MQIRTEVVFWIIWALWVARFANLVDENDCGPLPYWRFLFQQAEVKRWKYSWVEGCDPRLKCLKMKHREIIETYGFWVIAGFFRFCDQVGWTVYNDVDYSLEWSLMILRSKCRAARRGDGRQSWELLADFFGLLLLFGVRVVWRARCRLVGWKILWGSYQTYRQGSASSVWYSDNVRSYPAIQTFVDGCQ